MDNTIPAFFIAHNIPHLNDPGVEKTSDKVKQYFSVFWGKTHPGIFYYWMKQKRLTRKYLIFNKFLTFVYSNIKSMNIL